MEKVLSIRELHHMEGNMPYRIRRGDAVLECDTAQEALYLVGAVLRQERSERSARAKPPLPANVPAPEAGVPEDQPESNGPLPGGHHGN